MKKIVFLNGKFLSLREARLPLLSPGFLYGFGLFETMRAYNNKIIHFAEHLKRIKSSCSLIKMRFPYSLTELKEIIKKTVEINRLGDAYVRLTLWKAAGGTDILIVARRYKPHPPGKYKRGLRACIFRYSQGENYFLARLKTTNYLFYQLAYLEARERKFDEAIILNNRGYIAEASRSNIFLVKDNTLFTPALECGCLAGITRRAILDLAKRYNLKVCEGNFTLQDLSAADEAFLTNSLLGVMPLTTIEKQLIRKGLVGKITKFFMKKYNFLLRDAKRQV